MTQTKQSEVRHSESLSMAAPFQEQHFPIRYWANRWGFSPKTVREWFRDEYSPGILRLQNAGRRQRRNYMTIMISPSAAARVYATRTGGTGPARTREVM